MKCAAKTLFLAIFTVNSLCWAAETSSQIPSNQSQGLSCHDVRQIFGMKDIGSVQLVPDTQIKGDENSICPSPMSCCNPQMEDRYKEAVRKDLRSMLQTASSYLKTLIATSATTFRETFVSLIAASENQTLTLFAESYPKMESVARHPASHLFAAITTYVQGRDVDVEEQVMSFFDSLFPLVYHLSLNPKLKDFRDDYKECLRETREEIRPFGDIPQKLTNNLARSLGSARTFLQALSLGVEVINSTEHMDFGPDCSGALVKLTYCPHCLGSVSAKPCPAYCLNVIRGCLAGVAELDKPWGDFCSAMDRMSSALVGSYNAEEVLHNLHTRVSEAIMHAMENGPEITKKVKVACGHPKRATRDVSKLLTVTTTSTVAPSAQDEPKSGSSGYRVGGGVSTRSTSGSLIQRLQSFTKKLSESKSFYGNLADSLCNDNSLSTNDRAGSTTDQQCWNGHAFGEYIKTIAGVGVTAQKHNPEMPSKNNRVTSSVAELVDKLTHLKQIMNSKASSVPQSDSSVVEGSGSGSFWNNHVGDDEDYDNGGSGSGDFDKQDSRPGGATNIDDIHFTEDGKTKKTASNGNKKVRGGNNSGTFVVVSMLPLLAGLVMCGIQEH